MATDKELLVELSSKKYKEQAIWFLNAYWDKDLELGTKNEELERIWSWTHTCISLDNKKGEEGNELDEFQAHRLLEKVDKALTVKKMRQVFQEIDLDFNKKVSLTEFLIYKYGVDYKFLVNAPQASGDALKRLKEAEMLVEAAQQSVETAKAAEAEAREALRKQKEAEAEVKAALDEIARESQRLVDERNAILKRTTDDSLGIVKRNKAVAELAQFDAQDQEAGLRRAKIDQEAAVRKSQRATQVAQTAQVQAEKAKQESEKAFQEAQESLEELKSRAGAGQGSVWWMMRELEESKKYMSKKDRLKLEAVQQQKEEQLKKQLGL